MRIRPPILSEDVETTQHVVKRQNPSKLRDCHSASLWESTLHSLHQYQIAIGVNLE